MQCNVANRWMSWTLDYVHIHIIYIHMSSTCLGICRCIYIIYIYYTDVVVSVRVLDLVISTRVKWNTYINILMSSFDTAMHQHRVTIYHQLMSVWHVDRLTHKQKINKLTSDSYVCKLWVKWLHLIHIIPEVEGGRARVVCNERVVVYTTIDLPPSTSGSLWIIGIGLTHNL